MGMFDRVYVDCPHCGKAVAFQSKAGDCVLDNFTIETAPVEILLDVMNAPEHCCSCGGWVVLVDPARPPGPPPRPQLRVARVKPPADAGTHPQGYKWWPPARPFSFDDLV